MELRQSLPNWSVLHLESNCVACMADARQPLSWCQLNSGVVRHAADNPPQFGVGAKWILHAYECQLKTVQTNCRTATCKRYLLPYGNRPH
jgi:hypothetical protein